MPPRQERQQDWSKLTPREKSLSYLSRAAALAEQGGMSPGDKAIVLAAAAGAYATMEATDLMREGVPLSSAAMNDLAALTGLMRDLVARVGSTL